MGHTSLVNDTQPRDFCSKGKDDDITNSEWLTASWSIFEIQSGNRDDDSWIKDLHAIP